MKFIGYKLPPTYHLGDKGCGCAGDPPNYPTYFVRPIYTQHGNSPSYNKPSYYLNGNGYQELDELKSLWGSKNFPKLALDHLRTRAWIEDKYMHHHNCYYHPTEQEYGRRKVVIYPVGSFWLKKFHDDERWNDTYREKAKAEIETYNQMLIEQSQAVAIPDNHCAVVLIRRYYPEYQPELELINNPPKHSGNWWTIGDKPSSENCNGQYGTKHPVNGSWCQWCGWHSEEDKK